MNGVEILVCPVKRVYDNSFKVMAVFKTPAVPFQFLLSLLYSAVRNHCEGGKLIIMGDFYGKLWEIFMGIFQNTNS